MTPGSNAGCLEMISCPGTKVIFGERITANLEFDTVTYETLANVASNTIEGIKTSDNESQGVCFSGRIDYAL